MKIILLLIVSLLVISITFYSCKKEVDENYTSKTVEQTIKINTEFNLDLGTFGIEEGASITKAPTNASKSILERQNSGNINYKYEPAVNFVGMDEIEIRTAKGSNGSGQSNRITYNTIKLTIIN